ncbi:MAG: hypothetical protein ACOX9C_08755 [Kiritimatiellia bacterium]
MKTLMLMTIASLCALCAQAFTPASQATSAPAVVATPAERTHAVSSQEVTISTAPTGLLLILK